MAFTVEVLLEGAKKSLQTIIHSGSQVIPLLHVHVEPSCVVAFEFKGPTDGTEEQMKEFARRFITLARVTKRFEGAVMLSEAWVSHKKEFGENGKRPADDPDKEDTVFCVVWDKDRRMIANAEIRQTKNGRRLGEFRKLDKHIEDAMEVWADPAFKPIEPMPLDTFINAQAAFDMLMETLGKNDMVTKN
jgi:hypothetical protein